MLEMNEYLDKQFKEKYIDFQLHFMQELKQYSIILKDPQVKLVPQGQDKLLHTKLRGLNDFIMQKVNPVSSQAHTKETIAKYKGGIVFPFV